MKGLISKHFRFPVTNVLGAGIPEYLAEKEAAFDRFVLALQTIRDDTYANPRSRSIARKALRGWSFDDE